MKNKKIKKDFYSQKNTHTRARTESEKTYLAHYADFLVEFFFSFYYNNKRKKEDFFNAELLA